MLKRNGSIRLFIEQLRCQRLAVTQIGEDRQDVIGFESRGKCR